MGVVALRDRGRTLLVLGYANVPEPAAALAAGELRQAFDEVLAARPGSRDSLR